MKTTKKFRQGAASFYIVIMTSLLFGVIVIGFMSLVTREMKKSQENSLYQSSYDAALAGVEDAKLALNKYYDCTEKGVVMAAADNEDGVMTCEEILGIVARDASDGTYCDAVSSILERERSENGEVKVVENDENGETTTQSYTCVKMNLTPSDYRATLSSNDTSIRVVPLQTEDNQQITKVRISWYATEDGEFNYNDVKDGKVSFSNDDEITAPPTLAVQVYQTADTGTFRLEDFKEASANQTNRGTVWLVPSDTIGVTTLGSDILVKSNQHDADITTHEGQIIDCGGRENQEFLCEVTIDLPQAIGGSDDSPRSMNAHTFMLAISLPYNEPTTDFKVEMLNSAGETVNFENVQVAVDSTGRANDIFSRVDSRVEFDDIYFPYPGYALQLGSGNDDAAALEKNFWVTENCWSSSSGSVAACADSGGE